MTIWYLPLEPYEERYTIQLSAKEDGWFTNVLDNTGTDYKYVNGKSLRKGDRRIKIGSVLDACGRGYWSCSQIQKMLEALDKGKVKDGDAIYFEDFWHPGFSAIPYALHLMGLNVKLYALCHAQSVDPYDFTYPMRNWMRGFEQGESAALSGIFVTSKVLKDMLQEAGVNQCPIYITGLPYNSTMVKKFYHSRGGEPKKKKNRVVFSSRWDKEKNPGFFVAVAEEVAKTNPEIKFIITTSRPKLAGNSKEINDLADSIRNGAFKNIQIKEGLSKVEYYTQLAKAKVQFNCADQDFVSWTLLEATSFGCSPVYPNYLSFPECLPPQFLYEKGSIKDAVMKVINSIKHPTPESTLQNIYQSFDGAASRMIRIMEGSVLEMDTCRERKNWLDLK